MEARRSIWPDTADQRLCQEFMTRFPHEGPGMCYLFGALRAQGCSRQDAARLVREQGPREEGACEP